MKSGFFLSGTAHGLLISFLFVNGIFFMPERQYENLKKLDIIILSEAEFDAMASLPPSIRNFSITEYNEPKNLSGDSDKIIAEQESFADEFLLILSRQLESTETRNT